jgi:hypothetical protein
MNGQRKTFWNEVKEPASVLVLFLFLTIIFTLPLAFHINDYLAGDGGEAYGIAWNFWWFKKAVVDLKQTPFYTDYLFYPQGETLLFNDFPVIYGVLSIPLQMLFNVFVAYNILLIMSFTLTGFGMYLLLLFLTKNRIAALLGAFAFTFSPWHMAHAQGHFHLVAIEWVPFYVLYFLKAQEQSRRKYILLAGLFFALAALNTFYYLLYCAMLTLLYTTFFMFRENGGIRILKNTLAISAITAILLAPKIIPMAVHALKYDFYGAHPAEDYSADILTFLLPSTVQTIGGLFAPLTLAIAPVTAENSNYLGYVVLLLAGVAIIKLWRKDQQVVFFTFAGSVFFVLSLGIYLKIGGKKVTEFFLPYVLAHNYIPGFAFSGCPQRIHIMTVFCLSCLAAWGVKEALDKAKKGRGILTVGIFAILAMEFSALPFPISAQRHLPVRSFSPPPAQTLQAVPEFYKRIAKDRDDYALFDVNCGKFYGRRLEDVMVYQMLHNKKMVGGRMARTTMEKANDFIRTPFLYEVLLNRVQPKITDLPCAWRQSFVKKILEQYNIRYVIVPRESEFYPKNTVPEVYGLCKIFEDQDILVYQSCADAPCLSPGRPSQ